MRSKIQLADNLNKITEAANWGNQNLQKAEVLVLLDKQYFRQ